MWRSGRCRGRRARHAPPSHAGPARSGRPAVHRFRIRARWCRVARAAPYPCPSRRASYVCRRPHQTSPGSCGRSGSPRACSMRVGLHVNRAAAPAVAAIWAAQWHEFLATKMRRAVTAVACLYEYLGMIEKLHWYGILQSFRQHGRRGGHSGTPRLPRVLSCCVSLVGGPSRIRTCDQAVMSRPLCR